MATDLLVQILPHVKSHIHPANLRLGEWKFREGEINASSTSLNDKAWKTLIVPDSWGGYDKTFWFRHQVVVPQEFIGKPLVLHADFPEALLYLNGKPHQGLDEHHQEVYLTDKARPNQHFSFAIEAYSGRKRELNTFRFATLSVLNPTARALYNSLLLLHELEKFLGTSTTEAREIRELVRRTLIFLKYFLPDGEEYPHAIGRAYSFLVKTLETEFKTDLEGLIHLVPQSHIDVVWLWTLKETAKKCGRTFSTVLRLMEEYPEFNFVQSQAQLFQLTKEKYPDLYKQIKRRVTEGRWVPVGTTWVEHDCNIPGGESLIRQIMHGRRYFKSEFGLDSEVYWLPDTFGFTWALPQILRKSGIKFFFTTKLSWNDTNSFPYRTFWWEGVDGTKILAHSPAVGLDGQLTPKTLRATWEQSKQGELPPHVLHVFGYGDGGGGPTNEQIEQSRVLQTIVGMPPSRLSSVNEFFTQAEQTEDLPEWKDELYLEKHRGTYTTQAWVKRANRECETLLYNAELLVTLASMMKKSGTTRRYPAADLQRAWEKLLTNQFHDILPGTFIADATGDVRRHFHEIRTTTNKLIDQACASLGSKVKKSSKEFVFTLFNTMSWPRNEYVELVLKTKEKKFSVIDERGEKVEHQLVSHKKGLTTILCYVRDVPPFSWRRLMVRTTKVQVLEASSWRASTRLIESPLLRLKFDTKGRLSSLYSKALRKEFLKKGVRGNDLQTFKDMPEEWDAWDLDHQYELKRSDLLKVKSAKIVERGPLRATLVIELRTPKGSSLTQEIRVYHQSPRIDFVNNGKWSESQTLLKVTFPLSVKTHAATYEIQFGAIQRSTSSKESQERAKYEVPAQQWADLSDAKGGVSLLNDSKYGYDCRGGNLRLTLLRSPFYPHPIEPWRLKDTKATDQGPHFFVYAVYPHKGDWKKGETVRRARELNHPLIVLPGVVLKEMKPLVKCAAPNIFIDAVKRAESGPEVIIRAHEAHGQTTQTTLDFGFTVDAAAECNLVEEEDQKLKSAKSKVVVRFKPFEIKTLKLKLHSSSRR